MLAAGCKIAKGPYVETNPIHISLVASNPLDLVCMAFTLVDPSWDGKENFLVTTHEFSKFTVAVVMLNQKVQDVAKVLVDKWFYMYGIPTWIHSDKGQSFENDVIHHLCKMYGNQQMITTS